MAPFRFKIADESWEFEQIHRLNYRTFVEEIPQHTPNREGILVDRFHEQNTYVIGLQGEKLLGMMAFRDKRPFSLDEKLENLDQYLPPGRVICEMRLFAIETDYRKGPVLRGLLEAGLPYCLSQGYNLGVVSGSVRNLKMYKRIGFVPFGPLVGTPEALYQPMYLTLEDLLDRLSWLIRLANRMSSKIKTVKGETAHDST
jgi:N-acyl-L-homoserine lactone synthetase